MSEIDVRRTLVGSITWTISWATGPVSSRTGTLAVRSILEPGATVDAEVVSVTAGVPEALAALPHATRDADTVAHARDTATRRRKGDMVLRP